MILNTIPFELDVTQLFQRLRLDPASQHAEGILAVAREAAAVARPKAVFREAFIDARGADTVTVEGTRFTSRVLRANLAEVERVFPYVATCGVEMDAVPLPADDFLAGFCRDVVKEMALHAATVHLNVHLKRRYGLVRITAMHPGSGDAQVWPIQQQQPLFALLGDVEAQIGVRLTESSLMWPNKSVSGIYYPAEVDFVTCRLCHREVCVRRRAPFDPELWRHRMAGPAPSPHGSPG
ncbi:MAG: vitamin B12 dependent methionine synthase [Armatimonadetes bacterium]|nr:vitamin B12 dependent methionine synthase [Armatimonadota bacterium]